MIIIGEPNPGLHDIIRHNIENKIDVFPPIIDEEDKPFIMKRKNINLIPDEFFENKNREISKNKIPFYKKFESKKNNKKKKMNDCRII